jgi:hypothetical protein
MMITCWPDLAAWDSEYLLKLTAHVRARAQTVTVPRVRQQLLFLAEYYEDVATRSDHIGHQSKRP